MKSFLTILITIVLLIVVMVLGLKNQQLVTFNYLIAQNELRLSTLLAIVFMVGFSVALFFSSFFYLGLKMKLRQLRKLTVRQTKELEEIRVNSEKE